MKRITKRITVLLLILVLLLTFAACKNEKEDVVNNINNINNSKTDEKIENYNKVNDSTAENDNKEIEKGLGQDVEKEKEIENDDNEKEPISLSFFMTKDEIVQTLGDDYIFKTEEDGGYFMYYSVLEYDGITFRYYHDTKEVPVDSIPDWIDIKSNNYKFNFDIKIGDNARKVLEYCENNFENAYNHHDDEDIFGMYKYVEEGHPMTPVLKFTFSDESIDIWQCNNINDIDENVTIEGISIGFFAD